MAIKDREYVISVDNFNKPVVLEDEPAFGIRLLNLLMMNPGSNPLHPDMGVGLRDYRYGINSLSDLQNRIEQQIRDYLPQSQLDDISLVVTPDKILNVEIRIDNNVYTFRSSDTDNPIYIDDIVLS